MPLQIIGAGFGRTGTLSLKLALERLAFDPCYHMMEVMKHPEHIELWSRAADGESIDWARIFDGYAATVDWPGAYFWRELAALNPSACVLLSIRPADAWYESVAKTIYEVMSRPTPDDVAEQFVRQNEMARKLVLERTFDGRFEDRDFAIDLYERHNRAVREALGPDRLLVYEVGSGWEPLCSFLERPIPDEPYPHANDAASFREMTRLDGDA